MATEAKLAAERRQHTGKGVARKLRQNGKLPAVLYGAGEDALPLVLNAHEAGLLFHAISVENTLIQLSVDGEPPVVTLVREIQAHPYRPEILHVDFLRVEKGVELEVTVPLLLVGNPVGVKDQGGVLEHVLHEVVVLCIPSAIPESLTVDVSGLSIGDSIHTHALTLPEGVRLKLEESHTIAAVQAPRVEEDPEPSDEVVEPELIGTTPDDGASSDDEGTEG
jgi:large subunit ribosomal protein L25